MKKVIVIGAGIAGLTCGVYAQMNGFETEIYEMHSIPGGECTGWDRKGYHFDGCLHWLVGSKEGTSLNKLWRDTGALDDSVEIINYDIYVRYVEGDKAVNLYTDAGKLEQHLLELAPEDKAAIKKLCATLRNMGNFGMPIGKPMDMMTAGDGLKFAAKNLGSMSKIAHYNGMTMKELVADFKNPLLVRAFLTSFPEDYTAMAFITTLAGMNAGDCGFPCGGSRALAKRMEARFTALAGKVFYNAPVDKVLVEDSKAVGIRLADGRVVKADHVVSCADGYETLTRFLDDRFTPEAYRKLFATPQENPTITSALVFLGIDAEVPYEVRGIERQPRHAVHRRRHHQRLRHDHPLRVRRHDGAKGENGPGLLLPRRLRLLEDPVGGPGEISRRKEEARGGRHRRGDQVLSGNRRKDRGHGRGDADDVRALLQRLARRLDDVG